MKFKRRRFRFAIAMVSFAAFEIFGVGAAHDDVDELVLRSLSAPSEIEAGTIVSIEGIAEGDFGVSNVIVQNAFGRMVFTMPISSGVGRLDLPASLTQQAGAVTITSGEAVTSLVILPNEVAEIVAPLVGPRTIVADGNDTSLAVVLPVDRYGNQVADGTMVGIEWQQPSLPGQPVRETRNDLPTVDGMAWLPVPSGTTAGPTAVRATSTTASGTGIHGASVRIDEVPGAVADVEIAAAQPTGVADGRSLYEIESTELVDSFGNSLADGTVAQFIFDGPTGAGVLPGTVQNGVVRIELVAPTAPGTLTGHLELHGEASNDVSIVFSSAIASFDVALDQVGNDVVLRVYSAVDMSGAFVADGTEVIWGDQRAQLRHGATEIWLPAALAPTGETQTQILGTTQNVSAS